MQEFIDEQAKIRTGVAGWWERVIPELTDEQRDGLMAAAESREIRHTAISSVLRKWGHDVSVAQVSHWRRNYVR